MVALVEKTFGRLCQHFLYTHFELFILEFIDGMDGIDGKAAPPPSIPSIPSMFFCAFGTFKAQILRWLRWWILARTDATNAHFCAFAFLLPSDLATAQPQEPRSFVRRTSHEVAEQPGRSCVAATEAALEAELSENLSSCQGPELPAVSRSEFGGTKVGAGSAVEGVVSTPILKRRRLLWKLVMVPGIVFLFRLPSLAGCLSIVCDGRRQGGAQVDEKHEYLKVPEVAGVLRIARSRAYELVGSGEIPSIRIGRSVRVNRRELDAWLEGQRQTKIEHR